MKEQLVFQTVGYVLLGATISLGLGVPLLGGLLSANEKLEELLKRTKSNAQGR